MIKKLLLIGGMLLLVLSGFANADMYLQVSVDSSYSLDISSNSDNLEADAYGYAQVYWDPNATDLAIASLDGSLNYCTDNIFDATPSYITGNVPTYTTNGLDSSDVDVTYGTELISGDNYGISKVTLMAVSAPSWSPSDAPYLSYTLKLLVASSPDTGSTDIKFRNGFAKVLDTSGTDQSGTITDYTVNITVAAPPTDFEGPTVAENEETGNTVTISWDDLNDDNNGFSHDDTPPIYYDIYYSTDSSFSPGDENEALDDLSGLSTTIGGSGIAGTPALSDGVTYYFRMRAKDSSTDPDNVGVHKTSYTDTDSAYMQSVIPTDHTSPSAPSGFSAGSASESLSLDWNAPASYNNDLSGYLVIRYETSPEVNPTLVSASDNDSDSDGAEDGDEYPVGTEFGDGVVIYNGGESAYTDDGSDLDAGHLVNGTTYYYIIYAYDVAERDTEPYQQGFNYSEPLTGSGVPGVAPGTITDFYAISSPEAGQITMYWTNPSETWFGGVVFWVTTDIASRWDAIPDDTDDWVEAQASGAMSAIEIYEPDDPSDVLGGALSTTLLGDDLDESSSIYFFKAFAFNETGTPFDPSDDTNISSRRYSTGADAAAIPSLTGGVTEYITTETTASLSAEVTLLKEEDSYGINSVAIPFDSPLYFDSMEIVTLEDLINAINAKAGKVIVTAVGLWDPEEQSLEGATFDDNGEATYISDTLDISLVNLVQMNTYQISVSEEISFTFKNYTIEE